MSDDEGEDDEDEAKVTDGVVVEQIAADEGGFGETDLRGMRMFFDTVGFGG